MAKYSIQIDCDEWWIADSLREIGNEIENTDILDQIVDGKVEVMGGHYKATIMLNQSKEELIRLIDLQLEGCNTHVDGLSCQMGKINTIGYKDGEVGIYLSDGDFYCLSELSYNEIDEIYNYFLNH